MRKTNNLWKYTNAEYQIAPEWASEDESGLTVIVGFGNSPQQARRNARTIIGRNVNGVPVVGESGYHFNGLPKMGGVEVDKFLNAIPNYKDLKIK